MKAKVFALATAAGFAWMVSSLAQTDHNAAADSNRTSSSDSAQSAPNGMMDGMRNMMSSMMDGGMMSSGMMDGCPMMGGSRPNNQWRDGGSAR